MKWLIAAVGVILIIVLLRLGELATQVMRYQAYWHRNNQEVLSRSRVENVRYYVLGDSTGQGIGATKPQNSYPFLVAQDLTLSAGGVVELINLSKSGAKIADVTASQLPVMESLGVDKDTVVTIEIGANNMREFDKAEFEREMDELMGRLPKQTIISDIPSFAGGRHAGLEKNVLEANEILVRLTDKHGLKRAALYDRVAANHGRSTLAADRFHPSDKGYRENWAPAFIEQL